MDRENKICGILDVQGFHLDKNEKFLTREICFVNNEYQLCFEIKCTISKETLDKYSKHISYQKHQIHGLPVQTLLDEGSKHLFDESQLKTLIEEIYCRVRTENKPFFGIKNQFLAKILDEFDIPYFNFEKERVGCETCPPLSAFDRFKRFHFCILHYIAGFGVTKDHYRCSLRKSLNIWVWLQNKIKSDIFYDEVHDKLDKITLF